MNQIILPAECADKPQEAGLYCSDLSALQAFARQLGVTS